jgi:hypothetical protein
VRWVAEEDGDGAGYDVLSFEASGEERLLEVKTTNGSARTPFFLTRHEWRIAEERRGGVARRIFTIEPPLENSLRLRAETWRASFVSRVSE